MEPLILEQCLRLVHRGSLLPDPRYDAVRAIVLAATEDAQEVQDMRYAVRVFVFDEQGPKSRDALQDLEVRLTLGLQA